MKKIQLDKETSEPEIIPASDNQVNEPEIKAETDNNISIDNVVSSLNANNNDPEIIEKPKRKYTRRIKDIETSETEVKKTEDTLPLVLTEPVVKLGIDLYIEKLLKVKENPATKEEVTLVTNSINSILKRLLPEAVQKQSDIIQLTVCIISITLSRTSIKL
jgi:hypothetical protein